MENGMNKHPNGRRKRRNDVALDSYVFSVRLKMPVMARLRAQAEKEQRTMANLVAVFVQAGLDDRTKVGGR